MSLLAHQRARDYAEQPSGAVTAALDRTLAFAALMADRRQSLPRGEVLLRRPLGEVGADLGDDLQDTIFGVCGQCRKIIAAAHLGEDAAQVGDLGRINPGRLRDRAGLLCIGLIAALKVGLRKGWPATALGQTATYAEGWSPNAPRASRLQSDRRGQQ